MDGPLQPLKDLIDNPIQQSIDQPKAFMLRHNLRGEEIEQELVYMLEAARGRLLCELSGDARTLAQVRKNEKGELFISKIVASQSGGDSDKQPGYPLGVPPDLKPGQAP